jgi:hypothetical protein
MGRPNGGDARAGSGRPYSGMEDAGSGEGIGRLALGRFPARKREHVQT